MSLVGWFTGMRAFLREVGWYHLYILLLMLLTYMLNQLDRYNLPILTQSMARDLHYGDKACFPNASVSSSSMAQTARTECPHEATEDACRKFHPSNSTDIDSKFCFWDYDGQGIEYALLASILFVIIYTISGIFLGFAADLYKRTTFLAVSLFCWSIITLLTGFASAYWQLVILRLALGVAEAGCTPFATSILTDVFSQQYRGTALGVYNWGIYTGYSLAYALGDFVASLIGWRGVYYVSAAPGLLIGPLIYFTVREPARRTDGVVVGRDKTYRQLVADGNGYGNSLGLLLKPLLVPSVLVLCIAGAIRNGAGYVWGFYTQNFFLAQGVTKETIGAYMTPIPLIGGSLSAVAGGYIADRLVRRSGLRARVMILVVSQLAAAPFAAGVLLLPVPWAFLSLIPTYLFGEMWVSVCLAVFVELVPAASRTFGIACYFFIITNIGGNMPFLVPLIQNGFLSSMTTSKPVALRAALLVLYPGSYVVSALIFIVCLVFIRRREAAEDVMAAAANAASHRTPPPVGISNKSLDDDDGDDDYINRKSAQGGNAHSTPTMHRAGNGADSGAYKYGSNDNTNINNLAFNQEA